MSDSDILKTLEFMTKGFPNPVSKNIHTQLGVHFEEVAELLETFKVEDIDGRKILFNLHLYLNQAAKYFKENDNVIEVINKKEFLDSLCDQLVTATGVGYMLGFDIAGGFGEVNRSNLSKFDENGEPIYDSNLKLIKGPNYFKPDLEPYIK